MRSSEGEASQSPDGERKAFLGLQKGKSRPQGCWVRVSTCLVTTRCHLHAAQPLLHVIAQELGYRISSFLYMRKLRLGEGTELAKVTQLQRTWQAGPEAWLLEPKLWGPNQQALLRAPGQQGRPRAREVSKLHTASQRVRV